MPEGHIIPVTEIPDFRFGAIGFGALLRDPANTDIRLDFPDTVALYSGDLEELLKRFARAQEACRPGEFQQYIIHATAQQAVGLARFRAMGATATPAEVNSAWANVSLFVCHPFRGQGLGKLAMQTMLLAASNQFEGVWTNVRESNHASQKLITNTGFTLRGRQAPANSGEEARLVYVHQFTEPTY